jgi:outer membrane receptor protein involved in Fe transport
MRNLPLVAVLLVGIAGFGRTATAQTTGAVQGTVTDPQDAVLPGVTVQLTQTATNVSKSTQTGAAGSYFVDFLQPGTYVVTVSLQGFKTAEVQNVLIEASKTASVNVKLEVGQISESVQVQSTEQRVNIVDAQVSTNVGQAYVKDLPNYSRNVLNFATLQPGVEINTGQIAGGSQNLNILGTQASVNGNRTQRNDFYLDGMDSMNYRNEALQMPNPDAVQEVQISTSNTSAEYGRQVGGVFNVVSKSGTNAFHGSGFYFFRDKALNATPWGAASKPDQNQKTAGATLGGPVIKGKTFFFFSYDHYKDEAAITSFIGPPKLAPTAAMVSGDFSAFSDIIYDPATGQPFAGNIIPIAAQDPVGKSIAKLLPTVSAYGNFLSPSFTQPSHNQTFYVKGDHHWSNSNSTSVTWMRASGGATYPTLDGDYSSIPAWGPQVNESVQDLYHGRHTWILKSNLVADFRIGYTKHHANRDNFAFDSAFSGATDPMAALGAQGTTTPQDGARLYLPSVGIGNAGGGFGSGLFGHEGWLGLFDQPSFHFGGTVSWVKSNHNVKFGGDGIRLGQRYAVTGGQNGPQLNFDGRFSSLGAGQNNFVYGMADLLLGRTTTFSQFGVEDYTIHNWDYYFFVQDDWKVTPRLTLSPGLRYEFYQPPSVSGDQRTEYFTPNPVQGSVSTFQSTLFPNAPTGIAFAGDPGVPDGFYKTEHNLIAPRLGLAWDVGGDGKTAVRAGVGKYYGGTALQAKDWPSEQNPWQPSNACLGYTLASNPWLACQANHFAAPPTPFNASSIQNFPWPDTVPFIYGFDPNYKTAYNYQWNASVERELRTSLSVQLGYIGNRGRHLTAIQNINYADFTATASGGNVQARRPNQGFGTINIATSNAKSSYDALQAVASIRMANSLRSRITYTYQHGHSNCDQDPVNIGGSCYANPQNPAGEWGETQFHQAFKAFFTWTIPVLRQSDSMAAKILGGWQLSGNGAFYSGAPMNVSLGQDWNYDGVDGDRPDAAGTIEYPKESLEDGGQWFTSSGFTRPGGGSNHNTFGTLPRNAVFGPGNWTIDGALLKNFHFTKSESQYAQFRLEAYNLFNHPNLQNPNLTFTDPSFGRIFGKTGNRLVQLGLKFYF